MNNKLKAHLKTVLTILIIGLYLYFTINYPLIAKYITIAIILFIVYSILYALFRTQESKKDNLVDTPDLDSL